jgi:ATP-dependent DNA ligase
LYQYNDKDELIYICDAGSGIDDAFRSLYSDPQCYPRAVRVIYNDRTYKSQGDKSDALQFPRIDAVRDDKEPEECVNPRL